MNQTQLKRVTERVNTTINEELTKRFPRLKQEPRPDPVELYEAATLTMRGRALTAMVEGNSLHRLDANVAGQYLPAYVKVVNAQAAAETERQEKLIAVRNRMRAKREELIDGYVFGDKTDIAQALKSLRAVK